MAKSIWNKNKIKNNNFCDFRKVMQIFKTKKKFSNVSSNYENAIWVQNYEFLNYDDDISRIGKTLKCYKQYLASILFIN